MTGNDTGDCSVGARQWQNYEISNFAPNFLAFITVISYIIYIKYFYISKLQYIEDKNGGNNCKCGTERQGHFQFNLRKNGNEHFHRNQYFHQGGEPHADDSF